jgi:hypothetical protein
LRVSPEQRLDLARSKIGRDQPIVGREAGDLGQRHASRPALAARMPKAPDRHRDRAKHDERRPGDP